MNSSANTDKPAEEGSVVEPAVEAAGTEAQGVEGLQAALAELNDRYLRAKAETDNIRRRADADVAAARKYALESFAGEMLAVRDSLELASGVELKEGASEAVRQMREGLGLTLKLMDGVFQKFGITLIDPRGAKFDPALHQAISVVDSDEVPASHVVNVVHKGYLLKDRLLRPAMVVVAKARAGAKPAENA